jgi:hypothetical protein
MVIAKVSRVLTSRVIMIAFLIVCSLRLFKVKTDYIFHQTRQFIRKFCFFLKLKILIENKFSKIFEIKILLNENTVSSTVI